MTAADASVRLDERVEVVDEPPERRRRVSPRLQTAILVVPSLILAERAWDRRWLTDDGFINLRITKNIVEGHGPVFNAGERVEAATSTLWVWLLAAADIVLPRRLEQLALVLGLGLAVAGLLLATFGAARLHRSRGATGLLLPAGALVVVALPPFWDFSTSGLEGGLTFGWLGLVAWLLARWATSDGRLGGWAAAIIGLAPLVRPDLALAIPVLLGGVLAAQWRDDSWRDRARLVVQALAIPVAYQVFRMGYYGSLLPNTGLAKSGVRSRWDLGWAYLQDFADPYVLYLPLACLFLVIWAPLVWRATRALDRRGVVFLTALPAVGLVNGLYFVRVGGDYMHGRLLLPAMFALVTPLCAVPVTRVAGWRVPRRGAAPANGAGNRADVDEGADEGSAAGEPPRTGRAGLVWAGATAVVAVWALVAGTQLRWERAEMPLFLSDIRAGEVSSYGEHAVTAPARGWSDRRVEEVLEGDVLVYLPVDGVEDAVPRDGDGRIVLASYGIGAVGYALGDDVYIIDMLGLADPIGSRFALEAPGVVGHEKPVPAAWLAARASDGTVRRELIPPPAIGFPLYVSPGGQLSADAAAARHALDCGELADLHEAVHDDLTVGRFFQNIWESPRLTRLEVPPDPHEAEAEFCG